MSLDRSILDFPAEHERNMRAQVRSQVAQQGVPPHLIDPIVDMSFHAVSAATRAMMDVLNRLDGASHTCALGISAGLLKDRADLLERALLDFAKVIGARVTQGTVSTGGEHV